MGDLSQTWLGTRSPTVIKILYLFFIQNTMLSCPWDVYAVFIFVFCIPPIKYNVIRPLGCLIGRGENKGQLNNLIMGSIINPDWCKYIRFYFSIYQILSFLGHLLCSHMRWPDATAFCKSCDKYQRHDFWKLNWISRKRKAKINCLF